MGLVASRNAKFLNYSAKADLFLCSSRSDLGERRIEKKCQKEKSVKSADNRKTSTHKMETSFFRETIGLRIEKYEVVTYANN